MRKTFILTVLGVALLAAAPGFAAVVLNYASVPNATIQFNGDGTFNFASFEGVDFQVGSASGGAGDAVGLSGRIFGTFGIGSGSFIAPVSASGGSFQIYDADGFAFTADLAWSNILQYGAGGGLNLDAQANLTNLAYDGSSSDLLALASYPSGDTVLSFQFATPHTLDQLRTQALATSFSGTISSVPEPGALLLFGTGLFGLVTYRRARRIR